MSDLARVLQTRLVPWAHPGVSRHFLVARAEMQPAEMPQGVHLSRRQSQSRRVVVKNHRTYQNTRNVVAQWPDDGLQELAKYILVCVLDGYVDYPLGQYQVQCGPGTFFFIPPGTPSPDGSRTYVDLRKCASCQIITFLLHPNAVECWISRADARGRERINVCLFAQSRVIALLESLMEEVVADDERASQVGEGLLMAFFNLLLREVEAGRMQHRRMYAQEPESGPFAANHAPRDFATRLDHYVQRNLDKPLTLERVSRDMYLSPAQFARKVRTVTGTSFHQLVAELRLERARILLRESEWTVAAIAAQVGFQSSRYFCACFKRQTGQTPSEYRSHASDLKSR